MSLIARDIIALRNIERDKQANFRNLWQETADLMFPREDQITSARTPGEDKSTKVYDTTAIQDSQDMASGLSAALIPTGQKFFGLKIKSSNREFSPLAMRWLMQATEVTHEEMFQSNFMLQFNETLRAMVVFGTGCLYSEWDERNGCLNYKDHDISLYQIKQDSKGAVDTVILSYFLTARQAIQEFGVENCGEKIVKDAEAMDTESKRYEFIHIIRPRDNRNPILSDNRNMAYESVQVDVTGQVVVQETGYEEFPFAVARWMKSSFEKYGRGQGTECLADVKVMQQIKKDFIECGNKWNRPPLEVLDHYEGTVNVTPSAINYVREVGTIRGIDQRAIGNFPITKDMLEFQQEIIHKAFFRDIFVQMADLKGDRRTTVEIMQRVQEGLRRLALPVARLQSELLNPVITRTVMLLIRNGRIAYPPDELQGEDFAVEYMGQLALALRDQQSRGFMQWASFVGQIAQLAPEALDNINFDRAIPRMAESFGVNSDDMATPEEILAKRQARQQQMAAQMQMAAADTMGKAYKAGTKAPEEGSAAAQVMEAVA